MLNSDFNGYISAYLPAEVAAGDELQDQIRSIRDSGAFEVAQLVPFGLMVLNSHRQAVFVNNSVLEMASSDADSALGRRPGEIFQCIHLKDGKSLCGTTEFCRECGAAKAVVDGLSGLEADAVCRMLCDLGNGPEAMDLRVTAAPYSDAAGRKYTVFTLLDVSSEKRRRSLERIFFHDILNLAGGLRGFMQHVCSNPNSLDTDSARVLSLSFERLLEEICAQRDLAAAESGELRVKPQRLDSMKQLENVVKVYRKHGAAEEKQVMILDDAEAVPFHADPVVLGRVLGNMVKNALEASRAHESVAVGCSATPGGVRFTVYNDGYMPRSVKNQIFKRSFSTKGEGRGLGTYSILLLTERYLDGKAGFHSTKEDGTQFWIDLPA